MHATGITRFPIARVRPTGNRDNAFVRQSPFNTGLGVPEVWFIHRDTKVPEIRVRNAAGWHVSPNTGLQMRETPAGKLRGRVGSNDGRQRSCRMRELPGGVRPTSPPLLPAHQFPVVDANAVDRRSAIAVAFRSCEGNPLWNVV